MRIMGSPLVWWSRLKFLVGKVEVAVVVEDGHVVLVVGAQLLHVLERRGDIGPAHRGVGIGAGAIRREEVTLGSVAARC
jgi:hypothetical protein